MSLGVDHRARMDVRPRRPLASTLPELGHAGKVEVGIVGHDAGTAGRGLDLHLGADDDAAGARVGQLLTVFGIAEKAQVLRRCADSSGARAWISSIGIAMQLAPELLDDGA